MRRKSAISRPRVNRSPLYWPACRVARRRRPSATTTIKPKKSAASGPALSHPHPPSALSLWQLLGLRRASARSWWACGGKAQAEAKGLDAGECVGAAAGQS
jgi:hypothetical protein